MISITDKEFLEMTTYIKKNFGINLTQKRTLIEGRLNNLLMEKGFTNYTDYFRAVIADRSGEEMTTLLNKVTTNHTYFMREKDHFDYLKDVVLAEIIKNARIKELRIWCAASSSGEEPYTLAMVASDALGIARSSWNVKILATDISERALKIARAGEYTTEGMKDLPPRWKTEYFEPAGPDKMRAKQNIRKMLEFKNFNLMSPIYVPRKYHVIFCRNVMIYFDQPTKNALVNRFYDVTEPGGYLFIGHSESVSRDETKYTYVKPAVYRRLS